MTTTINHTYRVTVPAAALLSEPDDCGVCTSETLYGELVTVLESHDEWIRARQSAGGYEGYMRRRQLSHLNESGPITPATHWVQQRSTLLFSEPDLKSRLIHRIPFGSELVLLASDDDAFSPTDCGHFVFTAHCLPIGQAYPHDPLILAYSHFIGAPYRWGGRSPEGADCSGLVQMLARSQGLTIPRDSGDQEAFIDTLVPDNDYRAFDLAFWPGHTGILVSADELLHATAHTLDCRVEPLQGVIDRAGPVSSVKRLFNIEIYQDQLRHTDQHARQS